MHNDWSYPISSTKTNCGVQPFRHHHILNSTCQFMGFKECFLSQRRSQCALWWMEQRNRKAVAFSQVIHAVRWEPRAGLELPAPSSKRHHHRHLCPALLSHHPSDGGHFCLQLTGFKTPLYLETQANTCQLLNTSMIQQCLCKATALALDSSDLSLPKYVMQWLCPCCFWQTAVWVVRSSRP